MTVKSWLVQNPSLQPPLTATPPVLNLGTNIGAFFDMTEAYEIRANEGNRAYCAYERANANKPLPPARAFPFISKLLNYNNYSPANPLITLSIFGPCRSATACRINRSLEHYGLVEKDMPEHLRPVRTYLDYAAAKQETCQTRQIKLFFSTSPNEVINLLNDGCPAVHVSDGRALPEQFTIHEKVSIAFDLDRVLLLAMGKSGGDDFAIENEYYTRIYGLDAARLRENALKDVPAHPGPLTPFLKRIVPLRTFIRANGIQPDLELNVVTARNDYHIARMRTTLEALGFKPDEEFTLGPTPKGPYVRKVEADFFVDDGRHHVNSVREESPRTLTGYVPWVNAHLERITGEKVPRKLLRTKKPALPLPKHYGTELPPLVLA